MQIYLDNYEVDTKSALVAISHTFYTNYKPSGDNSSGQQYALQVTVNQWRFTIVNNTVQFNASKGDLFAAWQPNPTQAPKSKLNP